MDAPGPEGNDAIVAAPELEVSDAVVTDESILYGVEPMNEALQAARQEATGEIMSLMPSTRGMASGFGPDVCKALFTSVTEVCFSHCILNPTNPRRLK
jgi:hypothetical protein